MIRRRYLILTVLILGTVSAFGGGLARYKLVTRRSAAARSRLQRLGESLIHYRDVEWSFPPSIVCDDAGHPMHSWRALVTPYLEANYFGDCYDIAEAWNGEPNRSLHSELYRRGKDGVHNVDVAAIREFYCSPRTRNRVEYMSDYFMVVDSKAPFVPVPMRSWTRYAKQGWKAQLCGPPVLVVEVLGVDVHWMTPYDLSIEDALAMTAPQAYNSTPRVVGGVVVQSDGTVEVLGKPEVVERLIQMAK